MEINQPMSVKSQIIGRKLGSVNCEWGLKQIGVKSAGVKQDLGVFID
jgi:hypothetical protein